MLAPGSVATFSKRGFLERPTILNPISKALEARTLLEACQAPTPGVLTFARLLDPQQFILIQCERVALGAAVVNHLGETVDEVLLLTGHRWEPPNGCRLYMAGRTEVQAFKRHLPATCSELKPSVHAFIRAHLCWPMDTRFGVPSLVMLADWAHVSVRAA
jgi:hypothetical protein